MSRNDPVTLGVVTPLREKAAALLVVVIKSEAPGITDGEQIWVPQSCVHDDSPVHEKASPRGELIVKEWFAEEKGWI